jgi:preprotein translocase subunit SecF
MLTSRVLKDKTGVAGEKATRSLKTGLTMTGTTISALVVMIVISHFYQIEVMLQIGIVLLFGLLGDLVSTWITNVGLLIWFVEERKK